MHCKNINNYIENIYIETHFSYVNYVDGDKNLTQALNTIEYFVFFLMVTLSQCCLQMLMPLDLQRLWSGHNQPI